MNIKQPKPHHQSPPLPFSVCSFFIISPSPPVAGPRTVSGRGSRGPLPGQRRALGLRVVPVVLADPDVLDDGGVAGDLAHDDDQVADGDLGPPPPDDGDQGDDDGPAHHAQRQPRHPHHGALDGEDDLYDDHQHGQRERQHNRVRRVLDRL